VTTTQDEDEDEDEDSINVGQGWYTLVINLVRCYSCEKKRKELYEGGE
jgi:hypothetical protein